MNIQTLIQEVLDKGYLMSLATLDEGGLWVADVIYVHDENLTLYWMSSSNTRHSKAIIHNSKVAGTITVSSKNEPNLGIQFEGVAEKIESAGFDLATQHLLKRGRPAPKETDDVLHGHSWYALKPTKIDLIHEKHFGFEKKKLEF